MKLFGPDWTDIEIWLRRTFGLRPLPAPSAECLAALAKAGPYGDIPPDAEVEPAAPVAEARRLGLVEEVGGPGLGTLYLTDRGRRALAGRPV